jgi:hypothetical protein
MSSPTLRRKTILVCLVLAALIHVSLSGCAHFDRYEIRQPMADYGTVKVTWLVGYVPPQFGCGYALEIEPGHYLLTFRQPIDFNNGHCLSHELLHALGSRHQ